MRWGEVRFGLVWYGRYLYQRDVQRSLCLSFAKPKILKLFFILFSEKRQIYDRKPADEGKKEKFLRKDWNYDLSSTLFFLSFCLSVLLSFCLSVFLSFCLSVFLSFCLSVFLSFCLSVFTINLQQYGFFQNCENSYTDYTVGAA